MDADQPGNSLNAAPAAARPSSAGTEPLQDPPMPAEPAVSSPRQTPYNYTPQFSTSAAAILQRLHQSASPSPAPSPPAPDTTMPMPAPSAAPRPTESARPCTACSTASSSLFNPVVQCRRCAGCWHRLCHEPAIPDYAAAAAASWTCPACHSEAAAKAGRLRRRRVTVDAAQVIALAPAPSMAETLLRSATQGVIIGGGGDSGRVHKKRGISWAHRPLHSRRRHVAGLAPREMAYWLLQAVEKYPDFEMFPEEEKEEEEQAVDEDEGEEGAAAVPPARATVPARAPQYRNGIINSIRKSLASPLPAVTSKRVPQRFEPQAVSVSPDPGLPPAGPWFTATPVDPEDDPTGLMDGWPKPGRGLYAAAGADWLVDGAGLADSSDHASFSSIVYDESGRKVRENGMPLLA